MTTTPDHASVAEGTPVCSRCGSDHVVRDACARWDRPTRQWVLLDVHDCAFCESCETDGDDLIRFVPPIAMGDGAAPVDPEANRAAQILQCGRP
jgi:hypothetical protein